MMVVPRSRRYVAAIDLGSSRVRCLIYDTRGKSVGAASVELLSRSPRELGPLAKEFSPRELWAAVCSVTRHAVIVSGVDRADISAVVVTSQREGLAVLDASGQTLYLGPNTDLRAFMEGQAIDEKHGDAVYATTGHTPSFLLAPAKLHWLRDNRSDVFERIRWVLSLDGWVGWKLGASPALSRVAAVELGLADVGSGETAIELLHALGIDPRWVPPLANAGEVIGEVARSAAPLSELRSGTPIVAGGPDTQCGLLGMGITGAGETGILAGWSAPIQMVVDGPCLDAQRRTWTGRHVTRDWVLESTAADAGRANRWMKETMFRGSDDASLSRLAGRVPPGANGAMAFLGPERANMGAIGAGSGGFMFPLLSTVQTTTGADLLRASMENFAYAVKANIEQLEEVGGRSARRLCFGGGMAKDRVLAQVLADVLGREVACAGSAEVTALGAAMCGGVGSGTYSSLDEASEGMAPRMRGVMPHQVRSLEYRGLYDRWAAASARIGALGGEL